MNRRALLASLAAGSLLRGRLALARGPSDAPRLGVLFASTLGRPSGKVTGLALRADQVVE